MINEGLRKSIGEVTKFDPPVMLCSDCKMDDESKKSCGVCTLCGVQYCFYNRTAGILFKEETLKGHNACVTLFEKSAEYLEYQEENKSNQIEV